MGDILDVVTQEDLDGLRRLLAAGWKPPRVVGYSSGPVPDHSCWTETIFRDWADGLAVLHDYFPDVGHGEEIWNTALRNASVKCLAFLWQTKGLSASNLDSDTTASWSRALMTAMGEPWSLPHERKNILPVLALLRRNNVVLQDVHPGTHQIDDFLLCGHSLWTRAVMLKNWDVVNEMWPDAQSWLEWPRLNEVLFHLMDVVVGDYRSLAHHLPEEGEMPEERVLMRWLNTHGPAWFDTQWSTPTPPPHSWPQPEQVHDALATPKQTRIAAWLRLPLHVSAKHSNNLWDIWEQQLAKDPDLTWLRELSMYPDDPDVQTVAFALQRARPNTFRVHWHRPDGLGVSAHERWSNMGGGPLADLNEQEGSTQTPTASSSF